MGSLVRLISFLVSLYIGGHLIVSVLVELERRSIIRIAKGLSPMREFNRRLHGN